MKINSIFATLQSERYARLIKALGILVVALLIFGAGVFVGDRKAEFSYRWNDNYYRDFGGAHSPFGMSSMAGDGDDSAPTPHGAFGIVIGVNLPTIAVKGPHEAEKVIVLSPQTVIHSMRNQASSTDIKVGQSVIIIGEPDGQGRVNASLIRIVPQPPSMKATTTAI